MTNNEIRRDIERRIVLHDGIKGAFNNIVEENVRVIINQVDNVRSRSKNIFYIANMAVSFTISGFKCAGMINKLYKDILFERNENVVNDEIMNYAILKTTELLK